MPNRNGDDRPPRDPVTHRRYAPRRNILGDPINRGGKHGTKQAANELKKAVITKRILELRIMGLSNAAISEQLVVENGTEGEMVFGIVPKITKWRVHELLTEALDGINIPEAEHLKRLELERLDKIINGHFENACNGDVASTHAALACIDRRNRLLGIGQEQKITTTTLGADGKAVDPIRPVINLTIARRSD